MYNNLIFDSLPEYIKKKNFLLVDNNYSGKEYIGIDSLEQYQKNLETQSEDWYYRNNKIQYLRNSQGYRTKEFKDINWKNSIVVFGCSHAFGQGVDEEDTFSKQLENILGIPVINMGIIGSSIIFSLYNSIILKEISSSVKGVIHFWTSIDRTIYFYNKKLRFYGPWNSEKNNYMDLWSLNNFNTQIHAMFASMTTKHLWSQNTNLYEGSFFKETSKILDCDFLEMVDHGRDLVHPGRETFKNLALNISKNFKI